MINEDFSYFGGFEFVSVFAINIKIIYRNNNKNRQQTIETIRIKKSKNYFKQNSIQHKY